MKKIIAFYLPQFHTFPENDEWWGKGFTEWTNVKKAKPLFEKHNQPRVPLKQNYYCLLDRNTQLQQAEIAKEYGVYGFCYYHYWFNGKLLMEKPMEQMLRDKAIDIPFCISWANESWSRTWDGLEKSYLIKQEYGGKQDWKSHIQYLMRFFKDERYIKIDGKPLLLLYTACKIDNCREMVAYWKRKCAEAGLNGLYVAETLNTIQKSAVLSNSDAVVYFEPNYTLQHEVKKKGIVSRVKRYVKVRLPFVTPNKYDIRTIYKCIENRKYHEQKNIYIGTCNDWDNTARRGNKSTILMNSSPKLFQEHLNRLSKKKFGGGNICLLMLGMSGGKEHIWNLMNDMALHIFRLFKVWEKAKRQKYCKHLNNDITGQIYSKRGHIWNPGKNFCLFHTSSA